MAFTPHQIVCRAYAKINLGLRVTGKRADGFHDICTVFHRIDLFDEITLHPSGSITVSSTDPGVPSDESNICHAAARLLAGQAGARQGVRIEITKRVPAGAGLGGGSADAAAVLESLPALWDIAVSGEDLRHLALRLGSDVPFFLGRQSALGTGRGEVLEYVSIDVPFAVLLCVPPIHVSTAWAYSRIVPHPAAAGDLLSTVLHGMSDPALLRSEVVNDFEAPVFREHPLIARVKETMLGEGALYASMSGSGSSVFGFYRDAGSAAAAARALGPLNCRTFITPPHFRL
jgi:4-diphosphocytidyl-2-C-methyl-D-erythritol kinase